MDQRNVHGVRIRMLAYGRNSNVYLKSSMYKMRKLVWLVELEQSLGKCKLDKNSYDTYKEVQLL